MRLTRAIAGAAAISWIIGSCVTRVGRLAPFASRLVGKENPAPEAGSPLPFHVRIRTRDGILLAASHWKGSHAAAPAILILHGMGAFRAGYEANAAWFAAHGYGVLTVDLRGHGQSAAALCGLGLTEALDARAAFDWLKRRHKGAPIAVIGISMGGAAALLHDAGPLPADALVLQAVFSDIRQATRSRIAWASIDGAARILEPLLSWQTRLRLGVWPSRISPLRAVRSYPGPVLVIGGGADPFTPAHETRALFDAVPGHKQLWIVPGVGHYDVSHLTTQAYRCRILAFVREHCG